MCESQHVPPPAQTHGRHVVTPLAPGLGAIKGRGEKWGTRGGLYSRTCRHCYQPLVWRCRQGHKDMNSSHCGPKRMWHMYAHIHIHTEVKIWVKVPQCPSRLSATVDTHKHPWDPRVIDRETWCQGDTAPHSVPTAQPWSSAGTHHKQRPNRDTARRSDTSFFCGVLVTTTAQQTERKSSVRHTLLAASEPLRK